MLDVESDKRKLQADIKDWIEFVKRQKGWSSSDLAKRAGLTPSTITRLFAKPFEEYPFVPTHTTISKIANASGHQPPAVIINALGPNERGLKTNLESRVDVGHRRGGHVTRAKGSAYRLTLDHGEIALPAELVQEAGFLLGDKLIGRVQGGRLLIEPAEVALRRAQDLVRRFVPSTGSVVEDLIAERHAEADRE